VICKPENPGHRSALMEKFTEESGQYEQEELDEPAAIGIQPDWIVGLPPPELFRRYRLALGVLDNEARPESIEMVCWREQFLAILSNGSAAEALGALGLGTETIVQTIYQPFLDAIGWIGMHPRDSVCFPLHTAVNDHHQATLRDIAIDLAATEQGRLDLAKGMQKPWPCAAHSGRGSTSTPCSRSDCRPVWREIAALLHADPHPSLRTAPPHHFP
jgi:hypothetical protein